MVLPNRDIESAIRLIGYLQAKYHIPRISLAMDAGISDGHLYKILVYGFRPKAGGRVEEGLLKLVDRLKLKYPEDCPQEVTTK